MRALLIVIALARVAAADPDSFSAGPYELLNASGRIDVRKGKQRTVLVGAGRATAAKVDAKAHRVAVTLAGACGAADAVQTYAFDQLEARFVNTDALTRHRAKDWKAAAAGFLAATTLDPSWRIPAYNLASARALIGDLAGATAALAPWLAAEPIPTYVQVATDPELQPLLATAALAAVRSAKPGPGQATSGDRLATAYAPDRGLVAYTVDRTLYLQCSGEVAIEIHDTRTTRKLAELPLSTSSDLPQEACMAHPERLAAAQAHASELAAKRAEVADRVLHELGFVAATAESAAIPHIDTKAIVELPSSRLKLVEGKGGFNVWRDKQLIAVAPFNPGHGGTVTYLAEPKVFVFAINTPNEGGCPETATGMWTMP